MPAGNEMKFWTTVGLVIGSLAVFLLLSETVLRLLDVQGPVQAGKFWIPRWWAAVNPGFVSDLTRFVEAFEGDRKDLIQRIRENLFLMEEDPDLFWRFKKNLRIRAKNLSHPRFSKKMPDWFLQTDPNGFRIGEKESPPQRGGTPSILFLGDSSTFGWGVDYENAYPYRLKVRLQESGVPVRLRNLAMIGYSSQQGLTLLRQTIGRMAPAVAVISFGCNDAGYSSMTDRNRYLSNRNPFIRIRFFLDRLRTFRLLRNVLEGMEPVSNGAFPTPEPRVSVAEYQMNLIHMGRMLQDRHVRVIYLSVCCSELYNDAMDRVSRALGAPFVDSLKIFSVFLKNKEKIINTGYMKKEISFFESLYGDELARNPAWYTLFPDFCHPNPIGHDLIAIALHYVVRDALSEDRIPEDYERSGPK